MLILLQINANFLLLPNYFATRSWRRFICVRGVETKFMAYFWTVVFVLLFAAGVGLVIAWSVLV